MTGRALLRGRYSRRGRHPRSERAFTLIEIMVALGIMALLFSMIGAILSSMLTTTDKVTRGLARERVGAGILEVINRDLQGVYAYQIDGAFRGMSDGAGSRLELLTTRPPAFGQEDEQQQQGGASVGSGFEDDAFSAPVPLRLTKVGYFVKQSAATGLNALYRYEASYVPPPPAPRTAGQRRTSTSRAPSPFEGTSQADDMVVFEVYDRVQSFQIRYLDPEGNWRDEWREAELVPRAIEVLVMIVPDGEPPLTGYENAFERERKATFSSVMGIPIQLPPPDELATTGEQQ